jgi:hypothetical protein
MRSNLSRLEAVLALGCAALLVLAVAGPTVLQPADFHAYADQRMLWGLPHAMDVLSNLPFALGGLAGAWMLWRAPAGALGTMERAMAALFFTGLLVTAFGSSWYHLQPDDAGLAIDRYAMAIAFAGLLGLGAAARVSERAGAAVGLTGLLLAPLAVFVWAATGNVLPWALVQLGGMVLVLWLALLRPRHGALDVRWLAVLAIYGVAKVFELNDHAVYELTGQWASGHTLKHLVAAFAAWPVLSAIGRAGESMQNAAGIAFAKDVAARRASRA